MKTIFSSVYSMEQVVVDSNTATFSCSRDDGTHLATVVLPRSRWDEFDSPVNLLVTVEPIQSSE